MIDRNVLCRARLGQGTSEILVHTVREHPVTHFVECQQAETRETLYIHASLLTPMNHIPARHRKIAFDGVAYAIGAALKAYPKAIRIDPSPLSCETVARRIRESIKAKQLYGHSNALIDEGLFARYGDELVTSANFPPHVLVGPLSAIKNESVREAVDIGRPVSSGEVNTTEYHFTPKTPSELEELLALIHNQCFSPLPTIILSNLTPEQIESIESRYDVGIVPLETDNTKFIIIK